jgi:hypothetical protein
MCKCTSEIRTPYCGRDACVAGEKNDDWEKDARHMAWVYLNMVAVRPKEGEVYHDDRIDKIVDLIRWHRNKAVANDCHGIGKKQDSTQDGEQV